MRQWTLSLAVLALVAAPVLAGKHNKAVSVGDKAPAIAGLAAASADGTKDMTVNLADVKEDVVVVAFLANHCPAVIGSQDRLVEVVNAYKGKSVKFIGVCCSSESSYGEEDGIPAIKKAIKDGKHNLTYGYDPKGTIGQAYGAARTPEFFVLDKTRTIRYMGAMDDSPNNEAKVTKTYLKPAIDAVLANETVETPETRPAGCGIPYASK